MKICVSEEAYFNLSISIYYNHNVLEYLCLYNECFPESTELCGEWSRTSLVRSVQQNTIVTRPVFGLDRWHFHMWIDAWRYFRKNCTRPTTFGTWQSRLKQQSIWDLMNEWWIFNQKQMMKKCIMHCVLDMN